MAARVLLRIALVLGVCFSARAEAGFWRTPYVQNVTGHGALIVMGLSDGCLAHVTLQPSRRARSRVSAITSPEGLYVLSVHGLDPGVRYTYQVHGCSIRPFSGAFRTARPPGQPLHFAVLGDTGTGGKEERAIAAAISKARPDLLVTLGDNAYPTGSARDFQANFFEPFAEVLQDAPVFATLGNHEYLSDDARPFLGAFFLPANNPAATERYYSFTSGDVHFVSLDSNCALFDSAPECSAEKQRAWLERDLSASSARWKIVLLHHPPWSSGHYGSFDALRAAFAATFEAGGVDLVLSGHEHDYERTVPMRGEGAAGPGERGIVYVVAGISGGGLRPFPIDPPAWSQARASQHGFLDVTADATTLRLRAVDATGAELDAFTLSKAAARVVSPARFEPGKDDTGASAASSLLDEDGEVGEGEDTPDLAEAPRAAGCTTAGAAALAVVGAVVSVRRRRQRPGAIRRRS